ncbi:MAG: hypothetical protein AAF514_02950 [Verrucomicrobiota bacterium]
MLGTEPSSRFLSCLFAFVLVAAASADEIALRALPASKTHVSLEECPISQLSIITAYGALPEPMTTG